MRTCALVLASLLVGCSADKIPDPGPEFAEGTPLPAMPTDGKADSASNPVSVEAIGFGEIRTARFTSSARYRAFIFAGKRGQRVDLYVDGLAELDTVLYLYNAKNGKPSGRSLVYNDDTANPGWIVRGNLVANELSASARFNLPSDGSFALVASTYGHDGIGKAEVVIKTPAVGLTDAQLLERAKAYVWSGAVEPGYVRRLFDTELAASEWLQANLPNGGLEWLAYDGDAAHFVEGSNDLWSQRFVVDRITGAITVTHEH